MLQGGTDVVPQAGEAGFAWQQLHMYDACNRINALQVGTNAEANHFAIAACAEVVLFRLTSHSHVCSTGERGELSAADR